MVVKCVEDCDLFVWYIVNKFNLNAGKCEAISFGRGSKPIVFQYNTSGNNLERDTRINNLGVIIDYFITFVCHIECFVAKLDLANRISRGFSDIYIFVYYICKLIKASKNTIQRLVNTIVGAMKINSQEIACPSMVPRSIYANQRQQV
jgi:hypothetical protein